MLLIGVPSNRVLEFAPPEGAPFALAVSASSGVGFHAHGCGDPNDRTKWLQPRTMPGITWLREIVSPSRGRIAGLFRQDQDGPR